MTQEKSNVWWNSLANFEKCNSSLPAIPAPSVMINVCKEISPILYSLLYKKANDNDFWDTTADILSKITKIYPFPNPCTNFPLFILYLYTFQDLIKLKTLKECLYYVQTFCPPIPHNFFYDDLISGISDPVLIIYCFYEMNQSGMPQWTEFLNQYGKAERFFDLFMMSLTNQIIEGWRKLEVVYCLSDMMTDILIKHQNMVQFNMIASEFFHNLVDLALKTGDHNCTPFLRNIFLLQSIVKYNTKKESLVNVFFEDFNNRALHSNVICGLFLNWCFQNIGPNLTPFMLAAAISSQKIRNLTHFEFLWKLAIAYPKETSVVIVGYLSRILFQDIIFMNLVSEILCSILKGNELPDKAKNNFIHFILNAFISICIFSEKKKYRFRILSFLHIISSESFLSIEWLRDKILLFASFALSQNASIVSLTFDVKCQTVDSDWIESYRKCNLLLDQKYLPFKKNSNTLFQHSKSYTLKSEGFRVDQRIIDMGIPIDIACFLKYDDDLEMNNKRLAAFQIEDYIDSEKTRLADCEVIKNRLKYKDISEFPRETQYMLNSYYAIMKSITNKMYKFQKLYVDSFLDYANKILGIMSENRQLTADPPVFMKHFEKARKSDSEYDTYKLRRTLIKQKILAATVDNMKTRNNIIPIPEIMSEVMDNYDKDLQYFPITELDDALYDLFGKSRLKKEIDAICLLISKDAVEITSITETEMRNRILIRNFHIDLPNSEQILDTCIYRILFAKVFNGTAELNQYMKENERCRQISAPLTRNLLNTLNFSKGLFSDVVLTHTIRKVFCRKKISFFSTIEYETNPFDITYIIYMSVKTVTDLFKHLELMSDNDVGLIMYSLMIIAPPANVYAIARFLDKWKLILPIKLKRIAMHYINSVAKLLVSE